MNKSKILLSQLREAKNLQLIFSSSSKSIPSSDFYDISDLSYNGILIEPKDEAIPLAWDAGFEIKGSNIVISGGVGSSGFGSVVITLPVSSVNKYYDIYVEPRDEESSSKIKDILKHHNIDVK